MGTTSSAVKRKYNAKTYSQWNASIKKEDFAKIEELRELEGLSRSEFLKMLINTVYDTDL